MYKRNIIFLTDVYVKNKPKYFSLSNVTHIKFIPLKEHVQLQDSILCDLVNWNGGFSSRYEDPS